MEFFPTNAPDTHQGTQNSCFLTFRNVWVHFGSFRCCNKLGAKWAELVQLMQNFMPRNRIGTIHYERTRNTLWNRFATALNSCKRANLMQLMQKIVPRTRVVSFRYERTRCTPWDTKHETHVLLHFVMFECIWDRFATVLNSVPNGSNWCN